MIPKVIHYCWFGKKTLPKSAVKCIESWRRYMPDYEIKEWNEDNFDVNSIPYTEEAYRAKKYAFVSDYARFWILYQYGGLYFDTDVELIRPLDDIVARGPFMGCENAASIIGTMTLGVAPGLGLGVTPGLDLYKELLEYYDGLHFLSADGNIIEQQTIVDHTTRVLRCHGLEEKNEIQQVAEVYIYPREYFCPFNPQTQKLHLTENSYAIHWYDGSWRSPWVIFKKRTKMRVKRMLPEKIILWVMDGKKKLKG